MSTIICGIIKKIRRYVVYFLKGKEKIDKINKEDYYNNLIKDLETNQTRWNKRVFSWKEVIWRSGTCISLENELNLQKEVTLNIQEMKEAIDKDENKIDRLHGWRLR